LRLGGEHELGRHLQGAAPLLFSWAAPLGAAEVGTTLARLLALRPDAVVLFAPLGRIGDPRLGDVLKFVHAGAAEADRYSVLAPRDVCPFFFGSELGLIFPSADPVPRDTLERIGRMYEGNLQFLALAEAATAQARRAKDLEDMVGERRRPAARTGVADPAAYQHLIERIVDAVGSLPAKATVTVISRGDDRLLNLGGRRAWHFPGNEKGEYAGHHPADGADAVAHLESQRAKGAQYLLLPATANWWLEHYKDFRRHLETRYTAVCVRPETCIIFDVRRQRGRGADGGEKATRSSPRADKGLVRGAVGQAVSPRARAKDQVAARSRNPAPRRRPGAPPQDED
jgi:hypothetical protein